MPAVRAEVVAVLAETKALLVAKHEFDPAVQQRYIDTNLERFANEELTDTVERVGRQPLRKLSRNERFVGPAVELAEHRPAAHAGRRRCRPWSTGCAAKPGGRASP